MKKGFYLSVSAFAGVLALSGCLGLIGDDDNDESRVAGSFSTTLESEIVSDTPPAGDEPGILITRTVDEFCDGSTVMPDTTLDTNAYLVADGNLYIWRQEGTCYVDLALEGMSSGLRGTWTAPSTETGVLIPAAHRPEWCTMEEEENFEPDTLFVVETGVEVVIDEEKVAMESSGRFCFARFFALQVTGFSIGGDTTQQEYEFESESCTEVKIRKVADDKVATFSSDVVDGRLTFEFAYDTTRCNLSEPFDLGMGGGGPATCPGEENGETGEGLESCMAASGFFGDPDSVLMKSSARDFADLFRKASRSALTLP